MSWLDTWRAFIGAAPPVPRTQTRGNGMIVLAPRPRQSASALPRNLKRLMAERGLSVSRLAKEAEVSASTIRGIEQGIGEFGTPNPTLLVLLKLAAALNCGIEELVKEEERDEN